MPSSAGGLFTYIEGSLTRDVFYFRFFHNLVSTGPLSIPLGPFRIFIKFRGDICNFVFINGINDTGGKLFAVVNAPAIKLSLVLLCH